VNVIKWLYRLPGRLTGSSASTATGTSVEAPGMLTSDASAMGAKVVMGEVAEATSAEAEGSHADADDVDETDGQAGR
jgi:hypothetical protein